MLSVIPNLYKNDPKIIITNFIIQITGCTLIRVRNHLSWKEDRAKGGEVIRSSGYIYIKGGRGLLGFNYRNVCEARYSHTPETSPFFPQPPFHFFFKNEQVLSRLL